MGYVKTISFVQNIEDKKALEKYFVETIIPSFLKQDGLVYVKITSLFPLTKELSPSLEGVDLVVENVFKSEKYIEKIIYSELGQQIMHEALNLPSGDITVFIGQEKMLKQPKPQLERKDTYVKAVGIAQNMKETFEQEFTNHVVPLLLEQPGLESISVTSCSPMSDELAHIKGVDLIVENTYDSEENVQDLFKSQLGARILSGIQQLPSDFHIFLGKEKRFFP